MKQSLTVAMERVRSGCGSRLRHLPRIITTPVRLTGSIHPEQLADIVAIDSMVRRLAADEQHLVWQLSTVVGDAAVQRAVLKAVAREGDDRDQLGRGGFVERAKQLEQTAASDLKQLFADLRINVDIDQWSADGELATRAARVAFVRLYEQGAISLTDAVLDGCPSCETVVDDADVDEVELEVDRVRVSLPLGDDEDFSIEVETFEPELWVGAVALAVPSDLELSNSVINLPLAYAEVPLVSVDGLEEPKVVVPGHDKWSYELANKLGLAVVEVLDGEGVVRHPGSLEGLGRFAARAAAIEQLNLEGFLVAHFEATRTVRRCHRCASVLVPLLGRHWILNLSELTVPLVEVFDGEAVSFWPTTTKDHMQELIAQTGSWCVSQQLWSGHPIPVSTCLDCGRTRVSVEEDPTCGSCMGTLQQHSDVLDARFIAAITPLAMHGWPTSFEPTDVETTLSVGRIGLDTWALPMAALGLRLSGSVPYTRVVLHQRPIGVDELGQIPTRELIERVETSSSRVIRTALLSGDLDVERANSTLKTLDSPEVGEGNFEKLVLAFNDAMSNLDAGEALALLVSASREGIPQGSMSEFTKLVTDLLGDNQSL